MSLGSAIAAGRRMAEAMMVDTCEVKHVTGSALNGEGVDVPVYATRFTSPCKVQERGVQSVEREAGGHEATILRTFVHLPISAAAVEVDDVLTITAATHDPQLVGRTFRVLAPNGKSFATARRLEVEEVLA